MNTSLPLRAMSPQLSVAPQLGPEHMAAAAKAGFKSVINNRPDFEHGPDQPSHAAIEAAAHAAGLQYRFLPVDGGYQSPREVEAFAGLLQELPVPVLAFCRTGNRSSRLFTLAQQS